MPSIIKYKHKRLGPYSAGVPLQYEGIEFVRYNHEAVLIEWKTAEGPTWKNLYDQVRCLATLLASPAGNASQALLYLGFLPCEERELYGLVY
jgi:hypothetical protein